MFLFLIHETIFFRLLKNIKTLRSSTKKFKQPRCKKKSIVLKKNNQKIVFISKFKLIQFQKQLPKRIIYTLKKANI